MTNCRSVRTNLNYSVANGAPPACYFYAPDAGVKLSPAGTAAHEVEIHDRWPMAERCSADREGFEIHDFGARFDQFDATPHEPKDLLRMNLKYQERTGDIDVMRWSPKHRWVYVPQMEAAQALLLKACDSETDGRARFMRHSAFEDPTSLPDAPRRESIEVRTMAFF